MRAAVEALPGVRQIDYDPREDLFLLDYDAARLKIADVFAAVVLGGKRMGQEYRPRLVS